MRHPAESRHAKVLSAGDAQEPAAEYRQFLPGDCQPGLFDRLAQSGSMPDRMDRAPGAAVIGPLT